MNTITLHRVQHMPKRLEPGILYYSEEFGVAGHLCPCGCGSKIITPIGPTDWSFTAVNGKPTLYPSIGNWQIACRSHYWIRKGAIEWSYPWTEEEIIAGRKAEERYRKFYYDKKNPKHIRESVIIRFLRRFFRK